MTNAEIITTTLDGLLDHEVRLIIYGRAALALGFDNVPESVGKSLDLDVILPFSEAARIEADDQFWAAQQQLNKSLQSCGLYLTHIFQEDQVFLRPDWEKHTKPVLRPSTRWLKLFRPDTVDLILTKMMRGEEFWSDSRVRCKESQKDHIHLYPFSIHFQSYRLHFL
jgi:hypothetical protein